MPNRTDVNRRALNRNAPQVIDNNHAGVRLDQGISIRDRVSWQYFFTSQSVTAFQLVAGQNPDTDTKSHKARLVWSRQWSAVSVTDLLSRIRPAGLAASARTECRRPDGFYLRTRDARAAGEHSDRPGT